MIESHLLNCFEFVCTLIDNGAGRVLLGIAVSIMAMRRIRLMDETTHKPVAYSTCAVATSAIGYAVLPLLAPEWLSCTNYALCVAFLANWISTAHYWSRGVPTQFKRRP